MVFEIKISYEDYAKNKEIQQKVAEFLKNRDKINVRDEMRKLDDQH